MAHELVIRGGQLVDGTGAPGVRADLAISGGRIAEIGTDLRGDRVLDAEGHVVAPGFIDIHTHYDAQVFWDPALTPSCFHGVTTVVAGNCGFSIAPTRPADRGLIARTLENVEDMDVDTLAAGIPWDFESFPEYLDSVRRRGVALNFTAFVGHTALRIFTMGDEAYERAATAEEIARMQTLLREAIGAGAAGFASSFSPTHRGDGGRPIPSRLATREEVDALVDVMAELRTGVVACVIGQESIGLMDIYDLQSRAGIPFTYTALLAMSAGHHRIMAEINTAKWAEGAQVWPQVTGRPLSFSFSMTAPFTFNINPVFADLMALGPEDRRQAYADRHWRARALSWWDEHPGFGTPQWDSFDLDEAPAHPELVGRLLVDVAADRGQEPFDALLDLTLDEPDLGLRTRSVVANADVDEVGPLLADPHTTLGLSDAGAHVSQLCDAPQATDLLGTWVRERGLLPLETAVHKLTQVQAELFGLEDRGVLRPGAAADVTVFDPATVAPGPIRRVRDFPADGERLTADQPVGIRHVLVNGAPIVLDGVHDADARPGRLVRPSRR
ncbi:MAG: N-acyl-D-amino-acid deacylase family protein [Microthrixaceae bacterium]